MAFSIGTYSCNKGLWMGPCKRNRGSDTAANVESTRSDQETRFTAHVAIDREQNDAGR
jgi:hypothetical protein